jgi:hypothetical protein
MKNRHLFYCRYVLGLFGFLFLLSFLVQTGHGEAFANQVGPKPKIGKRVRLLEKNLQRLRQANKVRTIYSEWLMDIADVVGTATGIGLDGEPEIRVFTAKAGIRGIPKKLDNFRVNTRVTGRFYALDCQNGPSGRCDRPVPVGVSTGHPNMSAGTIGARVTDGIGVYALSNNHVYAAINGGTIGDSVIQPGTFDGGSVQNDFIGTLSAYEEIKFCTVWWIWLICNETNTIDAAIADVVDPSTGEALVETFTLPDGYGSPNSVLHPAFGDPDVIDDVDEDLAQLLGEPVQKYGRTTGLTYGTVNSFNATIDVCYDELCLNVARFVDQIIITPGSFSSGGDSGSLIVTYDADRYPVGLLFAGSATDTVANRIDRVLIAFDVDIDSGPAVLVKDIAVREVSAPASAVEGDTVNVDVTVENVGNQDVTSNITVTLRDNSAIFDSDVITGGLTAGSSTTLTFTWPASPVGNHDLEATATHSEEDNDAANDSESTTVIVELAVIDIAVTNISAPGSVPEGEIVNVFVTVENLGNRDVGTFEVILTDLTGIVEIGRQPVSDLVAGGPATTLTFPWDTGATGASAGDHVLQATHNLADDNTGNDIGETTVTVATLLEDLAIAMVSAPPSVEQGDIIDVDVRVDNVGNQDVGPFDVDLTDTTDSLVIGTQPVPILPGGATTTLTYSWNTTDASIDTHSLQATHNFSDDVDTNDTGTATVEVREPATAPGPYLRMGQVYVYSDTWTTVTLDRDYSEMVVVCTPNYDDDLFLGTTMPVVALVRNALGNSFQVRLGQAVGGSIEISEAWVHYMVVEAGVYDLPGLRMEADTFVSTVTDRKRSWVGQSRSYAQSYTSPVVVGQVISYYSDLWTVFWSRGSSRGNPPSPNYLYVGKHKGEDPRARYNERIGYIVIEAGSGDMDGTSYQAGLGSDTIRGVGNSPPYAYSLNGLSFTPSTAVVTQAGMDGNDGSWALLYGDTPLDSLAPDTLYLAVDEDWAIDSERRHTTEQVGYILFE